MGDAQRVRWMIAQHAWTGASPGSAGKDDRYLTFPAGARIAVVEERQEGDWWAGRLDGRLGWFPSAFCVPADYARAGANREHAQPSTWHSSITTQDGLLYLPQQPPNRRPRPSSTDLNSREPAQPSTLRPSITTPDELLYMPQQQLNGRPWTSSFTDSNGISGHSAAAAPKEAAAGAMTGFYGQPMGASRRSSGDVAVTASMTGIAPTVVTSTRAPPVLTPFACPSAVTVLEHAAQRPPPIIPLNSGAVAATATSRPQALLSQSGHCRMTAALMADKLGKSELDHELEHFPKQSTKLAVDSERLATLCARVDVWAEPSFADLFADTAGGAARCCAAGGLGALRGALARVLGGIELLLDEQRAAGAAQQLGALRRAADGFRLGLEIASLLQPQHGAAGLLHLLEQLVPMVSSIKIGYSIVVPALVAPIHGLLLVIHRVSEGEAFLDILASLAPLTSCLSLPSKKQPLSALRQAFARPSPGLRQAFASLAF